MKSTLVALASAALLLSVTAATAAEGLGAGGGSAGGMHTQGMAPSTPQSSTGYAPGQMREESPVVPGSPSVPSIAPGATGNSANGGAPIGGTMSPSAGGAQSGGY